MPDLGFFSENNPLHRDDDQKSRQKSALKLNVISIDNEKCSGIINDYEVTLNTCTCRDYFTRRLPCKHMYRLAHELGKFHLVGKIVNDPSIKNHVTTKKERDILKIEVDKLSDEEKFFFYSVIYYYLYQKEASYVSLKNDIANTLLSLDMVKEVEDIPALSDVLDKKELVAFLREHQCKIRLNAKKLFMLEELQKSYPELLQEIQVKYFVLQPTERFYPHLRSIYKIVIPEDVTKRINYYEYEF